MHTRMQDKYLHGHQIKFRGERRWSNIHLRYHAIFHNRYFSIIAVLSCYRLKRWYETVRYQWAALSQQTHEVLEGQNQVNKHKNIFKYNGEFYLRLISWLNLANGQPNQNFLSTWHKLITSFLGHKRKQTTSFGRLEVAYVIILFLFRIERAWLTSSLPFRTHLINMSPLLDILDKENQSRLRALTFTVWSSKLPCCGWYHNHLHHILSLHDIWTKFDGQ